MLQRIRWKSRAEASGKSSVSMKTLNHRKPNCGCKAAKDSKQDAAARKKLAEKMSVRIP